MEDPMGGSVSEREETDGDAARPVRGTWLVPPGTSAEVRAELGRHGARVVDGWWLTVPLWTADE